MGDYTLYFVQYWVYLHLAVQNVWGAHFFLDTLYIRFKQSSIRFESWLDSERFRIWSKMGIWDWAEWFKFISWKICDLSLGFDSRFAHRCFVLVGCRQTRTVSARRLLSTCIPMRGCSHWSSWTRFSFSLCAVNKPLYLLWVSISQAAAAGQQACSPAPKKSCCAVRHVLKAPREALIISVECITQYKSVPKTERLACDGEKDIGWIPDWGWIQSGEAWKINWTALPSIAACCQELTKCCCKKDCLKRCTCFRAGLSCTALCSCVCDQ